jgi:hypothetical protein
MELISWVLERVHELFHIFLALALEFVFTGTVLRVLSTGLARRRTVATRTRTTITTRLSGWAG